MLPPKELGSLRTRGFVAAASLISSIHTGDDAKFKEVASESFLIISAAEIFDKTFFIVMILTTTNSKAAVFCAASLALLSHVGICAFAGILVAQYVSRAVTFGIIVSVYFAYAILFLVAYFQSDGAQSAHEEGMDEARGDLNQDEPRDGNEAGNEAAASKEPEETWTSFWVSFGITFSAVFLGEFGDRTQVAMIGQHANYPVWPVCLGCSIAFLVQVVLSMLAGEALVRLGISKGTLLLFGATSFFGFAIWELCSQKDL